ncbi:MAG: hypothetical protein NTZ52_06525 [Chlamydiae bacterium]|nr:hypothetical protein [Chlamydiota bacterium]
MSMKGARIFLILSVLILNGCNNSIEVREEYIYDGYDDAYYYDQGDEKYGHHGHGGEGHHGH